MFPGDVGAASWFIWGGGEVVCGVEGCGRWIGVWGGWSMCGGEDDGVVGCIWRHDVSFSRNGGGFCGCDGEVCFEIVVEVKDSVKVVDSLVGGVRLVKNKEA